MAGRASTSRCSIYRGEEDALWHRRLHELDLRVYIGTPHIAWTHSQSILRRDSFAADVYPAGCACVLLHANPIVVLFAIGTIHAVVSGLPQYLRVCVCLGSISWRHSYAYHGRRLGLHKCGDLF